MKTKLYIALLFACPALLTAQNKPADYAGESKNKIISDTALVKSYTANPGDTCKMAHGRNGNNKGQCQFVDKDGDGINDCRAKGMGWSKKGKQNRFGKREAEQIKKP